jgi:predicted lipid-binding transport protein (Tim44 family)
MFHYLQMGLKLLDLKGETSRVDDLTLSQMVVTQARQEIDRDLITVWFQGKALEYILDKKSYKLQSGSMSYPMDLSEHWVFERPRGGQGWLLREVEEA